MEMSGALVLCFDQSSRPKKNEDAVADLKADDGMPEIDDAVAKLPWRTAPLRTPPRVRKFR